MRPSRRGRQTKLDVSRLAAIAVVIGITAVCCLAGPAGAQETQEMESAPSAYTTDPAVTLEGSEGDYSVGDFLAGETCPTACDCCYPIWYGGADALFLQRTRSRDVKIVEEGSESPLPRGQRAAFMTTHDLTHDTEWGPRIVLGRQLDRCRAVEFRYYGTHFWDRVADAPIATEADAPFDTNYTTDFDGFEAARITYNSRLHNVEVNLIRDCGWCIRPLIGFRFLNLTEKFDFAATDDGSTSNYTINTDNNLIGGQVGAVAGGQPSDCFTWGLYTTAGVYGNLTWQRSVLGDNNNVDILHDYSVDESNTAFVGEIGLDLSYHFSPCFSVVGGYQLLWVEGVALAPEQLDFSTTPLSGSRLNDNGGVFYNGGYIGFRIQR